MESFEQKASRASMEDYLGLADKLLERGLSKADADRLGELVRIGKDVKLSAEELAEKDEIIKRYSELDIKDIIE